MTTQSNPRWKQLRKDVVLRFPPSYRRFHLDGCDEVVNCTQSHRLTVLSLRFERQEDPSWISFDVSVQGYDHSGSDGFDIDNCLGLYTPYYPPVHRIRIVGLNSERCDELQRYAFECGCSWRGNTERRPLYMDIITDGGSLYITDRFMTYGPHGYNPSGEDGGGLLINASTEEGWQEAITRIFAYHLLDGQCGDEVLTPQPINLDTILGVDIARLVRLQPQTPELRGLVRAKTNKRMPDDVIGDAVKMEEWVIANCTPPPQAAPTTPTRRTPAQEEEIVDGEEEEAGEPTIPVDITANLTQRMSHTEYYTQDMEVTDTINVPASVVLQGGNAIRRWVAVQIREGNIDDPVDWDVERVYGDTHHEEYGDDNDPVDGPEYDSLDTPGLTSRQIEQASRLLNQGATNEATTTPAVTEPA